jgi:hypothetical protein
MDSDDEAKLMLAACNAAAEVFVDAFQEEEDTETPKRDHRREPRPKRLKFNHARAQQCSEQDYLGPNALYGRQFHVYFRISRSRFQLLMEKIMNSGISFYQPSEMVDRFFQLVKKQVTKHNLRYVTTPLLTLQGLRTRINQTAVNPSYRQKVFRQQLPSVSCLTVSWIFDIFPHGMDLWGSKIWGAHVR